MAYLSPTEFSHVLQYFKNYNEIPVWASRLGEIVANYVLDNYSSWTLLGYSRQYFINRFLNSSSLSRESLEDIFTEPTYDLGEVFMDGGVHGSMLKAVIKMKMQQTTNR